jgi:hypothetical protein
LEVNSSNGNEEQKNGDILGNFTVGKNERYLITKLKSYNITVEKIDAYLQKLRIDNSLD